METGFDLEVRLLGSAQDGGVPHAGCRCIHCQRALEDPTQRQFATSLAIIDRRQTPTRVWLIDATPDLTWQLEMLGDALSMPERPRRLRQPDGVFLTHAHMGHVGGLQQFGRESMGVRDLTVYAGAELQDLLRQSRLIEPTVERFQFSTLTPDRAISLAPDLRIEPLAVPHRDEWGVGTFGFRISGPVRSVLYLPDIDRWELWERADEVLRSVDVAIVDACFYDADEIGGRTDIPHPFVTDTLARYGEIPGTLVLTHLNHTNPLLDPASPRRVEVERRGAVIASAGLRWSL